MINLDKKPGVQQMPEDGGFFRMSGDGVQGEGGQGRRDTRLASGRDGREVMKSLYSTHASLLLITLSLVPLKGVCLGMAPLAWSVGRTLLAFGQAAAMFRQDMKRPG